MAERVSQWLEKLGLGQYAQAFEESAVDLEVLPELNESDLEKLGVLLGHRKKILKAIAQKLEGGEGSIAAPSVVRPALPQSYTPGHLAKKILTSRSALEGERKQVTVLFADIKGSLELIESSDPEAAHALLGPTIRAMMDAVHRYEGTVNKFLGDGLMALFGAPVAHEDHAVRACYAGLAIQEAIGQHAQAIFQSQGINIQARVGLHSGDVVVRSIGNDLSMDYDAIGPTTHLAARMEQLAIPGSIFLTSDTMQLTEGFVQVASLGEVPVKGLSNPIEVFELTGFSRLRSRLQTSAARGLTKFVGRQAELRALDRAITNAGEGKGQVVAVVGEAGVGKSRLYHEFVRSHRAKNWLVLESGSVSYGKATPYLPVIDLLKGYFGIEERGDARDIRERITSKLLTLDETLRRAVPAFLSLLNVPVEDKQWRGLDPSQRRQRTQVAVNALLLRESTVQPLIVVFEDLHWIDNETQAILDGLIESLSACELLLMVNYRPEFRDKWGDKSYITRLRIEPLRVESAEELLTALLGDDNSLAELKRTLIERTEGNPFYLEESVRTLIETKALVGERGDYRLARAEHFTEMPVAVEAMIAARIDRLSPENKRLLQCASVIGKDVPYGILQQLTDVRESELQQGLSDLQAAEFVYETQLHPELEYTFKHPLTREVAYGGLLTEQRRALHIRAANAFEKLYAGHLDQHASSLAVHCREANALERAIPYTIQAGDNAADRYATPDATIRYQEALEMARLLPTSEKSSRFQIRAILKLANVASNREQFVRDLENLQQAQKLAEELDHKPRLSQVLYWIGRVQYVLGRYELGVEFCEKALAIAETVGGDRLTAPPINLLGRLHSLTYPGLGAHLLARSVEQMHVLGNQIEEAAAAGLLGWLYSVIGQFSDANKFSERGVTVAEPTEHLPTLAACLQYRGQVLGCQGELERSLRDFARAIDIAEETGDTFRKYLVYGSLGHTQLLAGNLDRAIADLIQCKQLARQIGTDFHLGGWLTYFAEAHLRSGNLEEALATIGEALKIANDSGQPLSKALASRVLAQCRLAGDPPETDGAQEVLETAIPFLEERQMNFDLAHTLSVLAQCLRTKGDIEGSTTTLGRALKMFENMGLKQAQETAQADFAFVTR